MHVAALNEAPKMATMLSANGALGVAMPSCCPNSIPPAQ